MTKLFTLVRERLSENKRWTDYFTIDEGDDPEQCLRAAVREFLLTKEGTEAIKESSEDFNWGDAVLYVPEHILMRNGIQTMQEGHIFFFSVPMVVEVNQDEILIPTEYCDAK